MLEERYKKTLIEPKVRLLLSIYLQGFPQRSSKRKKLENELSCDKGNLSKHITSLLHDNLIQSTNPDRVSPPYKVTKQGKKFLKPIILSFQIGLFIIIWAASWGTIFYVLYNSQPIMMAISFLVIILGGFVTAALILIFQPYVLLRVEKQVIDEL